MFFFLTLDFNTHVSNSVFQFPVFANSQAVCPINISVQKDQRRRYEPPPVSGNVYPIPEKFNSYKDYVNIFIPHLLQEAWEQVMLAPHQLWQSCQL